MKDKEPKRKMGQRVKKEKRMGIWNRIFKRSKISKAQNENNASLSAGCVDSDVLLMTTMLAMNTTAMNAANDIAATTCTNVAIDSAMMAPVDCGVPCDCSGGF